jgi:hypothetical protein
MIYDKIRNLPDIVGKEAYSLCWPLGGPGKTRKDYFLSKDFIKGHFHCQPYDESGAFAGIKEGICNCFLIDKKEKLNKDEIETADLFSYQIPDFYGKKIDDIGEVDSIGIDPTENRFSDNKRFVILWKDEGKITAMVPKKIGYIPNRYKNENGVSITQRNTLLRYFQYTLPALKDKNDIKPIGLWYTNSSLERTPAVNIEDAWDTAMMTYYHPKLTESEELPGHEELPKEFRLRVIKTYSSEERMARAKDIFENSLFGVSRRLADNANGNFLAAYNLHDYLKDGFDHATVEAFGGTEKFLDSFMEIVGKKFKNVKLAYEDDVPVVLASDKEIII